MTARIALRVAAFRKYARLKGWTTASQVARALSIDPATLSRIVNGRIGPGEKFIAAALAAFPELDFTDLFEVQRDDEHAPDGAVATEPPAGAEHSEHAAHAPD